MATDVGKNGYVAQDEFARRTKKALDTGPDLLHRGELLVHDAQVHEGVWSAMDCVARELMPLGDARVLDVGCGYGRWAPLFHLLGCETYVGIDPQRGRVLAAAGLHAGAGVTFFPCETSAFASAFPGKFDVVFCCTVIQHLLRPDKEALVGDLCRLRAAGGKVVLWEGQLYDVTPAKAEALYDEPEHQRHMVPWARSALAAAAAPLEVRRVERCLYVIEEPVEC